MVSIGEGSKQSIRSQLSGMGSNMVTIRPFSTQTIGGGATLGSSGVQTLKVQDIDAIRSSSPHVTAVSPAVSSSGQVINASKNWPTQMQGVAPEYLDIRDW